MAQTEDTEFRDLVIDALEKNGSLAKIRAKLRANVFLAFQDDELSTTQNVSLDKILKVPEGILSLSIVQEFLEFCDLKNTLFVYTAESRSGRGYKYEGQKILSDKMKFVHHDGTSEPILVTLLKDVLKSHKKYAGQGDQHIQNERYFTKKEQNSTYVVNDDSSSNTNNSQSDNSSDEKNQFQTRLNLDHFDTDTSSDSAGDKTNSIYIPSEHIPTHNVQKKSENLQLSSDRTTGFKQFSSFDIATDLSRLSTSDSTYLDLKPFSSFDEKLLNTTGLPLVGIDERDMAVIGDEADAKTQEDIIKPILMDPKQQPEKTSDEIDYSNDFSSSTHSKSNIIEKIDLKSPESTHEESLINQNQSMESSHQNSQSSQSSVSISDVADLLECSDKSIPALPENIDKILKNVSLTSPNIKSDPTSNSNKKSLTDESTSGSPIPSLSNISLDVHSD